MHRGLFAIALGGSLVVAQAASVAAHGDHDHDHGLVPVCVIVEAADPPEVWDVASFTRGLADGSVLILDVDPEECHGVEPAGEPPTPEAAEAWRTITASVFADELAWDEFVLEGGVGMNEEELLALQATVRGYVETLEAVGTHACYEEVHRMLLESADSMDAAITDLIAGESTRAWVQLDDAYDGILEYWFAVEDGICEV